MSCCLTTETQGYSLHRIICPLNPEVGQSKCLRTNIPPSSYTGPGMNLVLSIDPSNSFSERSRYSREDMHANTLGIGPFNWLLSNWRSIRLPPPTFPTHVNTEEERLFDLR